VTSCSIATGVGNCWFSKSFCFTDSVCLGRKAVPLTAEIPLFLLLSAFHLAGDVEKHALGALRAQCAEGTRKARTASECVDAALGRNSREAGIVAMALVWAVPADAEGRSSKVAAGKCDRGLAASAICAGGRAMDGLQAAQP